MTYCLKCGQRAADGENRCPACGAPVPTQPVPDVIKPYVSVKDRVLGIVGMVLGIENLVGSIFSLMVIAIFLSVVVYAHKNGAMGAGVALFLASNIYGMPLVPLSLVGRMLCRNSMKEGNTSKTCSVGIKLNLTALVLSGIMLALGLCGLFLV